MKILAVLISSMLEFMKDENTDMNMILYIKFNVNVIVKCLSSFININQKSLFTLKWHSNTSNQIFSGTANVVNEILWAGYIFYKILQQ